MEKQLFTPQDAAEYLQVSVETIWRWCRENTLPAVKIGKFWRIPRWEVEAFIHSELETKEDLETDAPDGSSEKAET